MFRKIGRWKKLWVVALVVLAAMAGSYYVYSARVRATTSGAEPSSLKTTRVRRGDLTLSATAAGTVIAANELDLGFQSGGILVELPVKVGDKVKAGDVLARIDDLDARKTLGAAESALASAQLALQTARKEYAELTAHPTEAEVQEAQAALAEAQQAVEDLKAGATEAAIAEAEAAVATAYQAYLDLKNGPDAEKIERAEMALAKAKNSLWATQNSRDLACSRDGREGCDSAKAAVANAELAVREAELDLAALKKPATQTELSTAWAAVLKAQQNLADLKKGSTAAALSSAQAKVTRAQQTLDELLAGPTQEEIAIAQEKVKQAELAVAQAELALEVARRDATETTLTAPYDGTITAVTAVKGQRVGSTAFISLADLSQPLLEVLIDQSDMESVAVGYEAEVEFDALPGVTFKGRVAQVDPALVTKSNVDVIRALVLLDTSSFAKPQTLPIGLSATVDIIGGRAQNALLVPVEALREIDKGQYAVFVVENGTPTLRVVEVGLMDMTYAEIKSGLQLGETVSTGLVEVR